LGGAAVGGCPDGGNHLLQWRERGGPSKWKNVEEIKTDKTKSGGVEKKKPQGYPT